MMPSEEDLDSIMEGMDTDKSGKIQVTPRCSLLITTEVLYQWEQWLKAYTRKNQRRKKSNDPDDVTQMEEMLRRKRGQVSAESPASAASPAPAPAEATANSGS
mmetsp:Transcript_27397/g.51142  ORF Transcript_27397/g.51142 Transcript_27397/m.51142 type:complete len:103 (-) Transcript_27397:238-546(-)